ncbi:hypothetical protein [Azorhizophilus paspali]|uniref:Uncharacterized protein n=2 Tax=Azorhizophilus paspali TaxID=69963 RepID=A0ABV6SL98_AZOPA
MARRKWRQTGLPFRFRPGNRIMDAPPTPSGDGASRESVTLAKLCALAVDLIRGKRVRISPQERDALSPMFELSYLQCEGDSQDATGHVLCHCSHPALFEFYFFYRWLPEHGQRFRPRREPPPQLH